MIVGHVARALLAGLASAVASPAQAVYLSESNGVATLQGALVEGDADRFKAFLAAPRAVPIRVLYLSSPGGRVNAGIAIGRQVRVARLTTVVDASAARCDSACTYIFVGGVNRHYVNGDSVYEGFSGNSGLGFHPAHRKGATVRDDATLLEAGSERARSHYAAMGVPRAAELMDKAAFNTLFRPNGRTALQLRIATSLAAP